ncbi:MAG: hypothetical protein EOP09_13525 [Proteobacteria bacterium]|nr:MAG: hypothetical protein EOP09_13525 [Pseudomonadota bacterium]
MSPMVVYVGNLWDSHSGGIGIVFLAPEVLITPGVWKIVHDVNIFELWVAFPFTVGIKDGFENTCRRQVSRVLVYMTVPSY